MSLPKDSLLFGLRDTMTDEQEEMLTAILTPPEEINCVIVNAKAGTGKTLVATMGAKLRNKKLIYLFAPVNEGEMGYLPGEKAEKEAPYLMPLRQALSKIREDGSKINGASYWISAFSHVYERGVNYEDCTVIIDEAQNWTLPQLRKVLTRCHDNVKVILIGHFEQIDLEDPKKSGFEPYLFHLKAMDWVKVCHLTKNFRGRLAQWSDAI